MGGQEQNAVVEDIESVDLSGVTDEELNEYGSAPMPDGDSSRDASGDDAKADTSNEQVGSEEAKEPDIAAQLEEMKARLEKAESKTEHWRRVGNEHSQELGALRKMREQLIAERERRRQANPQDLHQRFIDDPRSFQNEIQENLRLEQQIQQAEQQEQQYQQRMMLEQRAAQIQHLAPDIGENLDEITEILKEHGDDPAQINQFRQAYMYASPAFVATLNYAAKQRKAVRELQEKLDASSKSGEEMLTKIERTAKGKPMTAAASGGKSKGKANLGEITENDLANMSDEELEAFLKNAPPPM